MTDADKAWKAALNKIGRVRRAGGTQLDLSGEKFHALAHIPPQVTSIAGLLWLDLDSTQITDLSPLAPLTTLQTLWLNNTPITDLSPLAPMTALHVLGLRGTPVSDLSRLAPLTALQSLGLNGTQVTDLSPLSGLTALQALFLDDTQVTDLRPIRDLPHLVAGMFHGLWFHNTPFGNATEETRRLAAIEDDEQRTHETLAFLRTLPPWPEPLPWETPKDPPSQDPAARLIWGDKGFTFFADQISADPVSGAVLDDLRDRIADLKRKGNQHDDLYRVAEDLEKRCPEALDDLNAVRLHLSYQRLRRLNDDRGQRQQPFDDETVSTIGAILELVPGLTLASGDVRVLIERQDAERALPVPAGQQQAADAVLATVQKPEAPFEDDVRTAARAAMEPGHHDRLSGLRGILSNNIAVVALTFVSTRALDGAISGPVGNYVYEHGADLLGFAQTMGSDGVIWAQSVMGKFRADYEVAAGIAREATMHGLPRQTPKAPKKPKLK